MTAAVLEELIFQKVMPQIAQLQYAMAADQFLLVELLQDLARTKPNPAQYLDGLYERVLARWEQSDLHPELSKVESLFREALNNRLVIARRTL